MTNISDKMAVYGKICWLWANSSLHKSWTAELQARMIIPAIETGQYELFEENGMPVSYCSWAWMSLEAEVRYVLDSAWIPAEDWRSGDRLWLAELVAPFEERHTVDLAMRLDERFAGHTAHAIRVYEDGRPAKITPYSFKGVTAEDAKRRHDQHFQELMNALKKHKDCDVRFSLEPAAA